MSTGPYHLNGKSVLITNRSFFAKLSSSLAQCKAIIPNYTINQSTLRGSYTFDWISIRYLLDCPTAQRLSAMWHALLQPHIVPGIADIMMYILVSRMDSLLNGTVHSSIHRQLDISKIDLQQTNDIEIGHSSTDSVDMVLNAFEILRSMQSKTLVSKYYCYKDGQSPQRHYIQLDVYVDKNNITAMLHIDKSKIDL